MKTKKAPAALLLLACLAGLAGCGGHSGDEKSGEVVSCGGDPLLFELACEDGSRYGFVTDENTRLAWEDRSAFALWEDTADFDGWDAFSCDLYVTVVPGPAVESADDEIDTRVEGWYRAEEITVTGTDEDYFAVCAKPVIYLYPETTTEVDVRLAFDGTLTCTYPRYEDGWHVTARPDGTLTDAAGQRYSYLYWEGASAAAYDFSQGFCVAGPDTAAFLEDALARLGMSRREANEFIVYWLPLMEPNAFNLISFQSNAYTDRAVLDVVPAPDTVLRVFMAWKPLVQPVAVDPQVLAAPERTGFTLVEWGGARVGG